MEELIKLLKEQDDEVYNSFIRVLDFIQKEEKKVEELNYDKK